MISFADSLRLIVLLKRLNGFVSGHSINNHLLIYIYMYTNENYKQCL